MRKILVMFLATTLMFGLVGCGENKSEISNNNSFDETINSVVEENVLDISKDEVASDVGLELTYYVPGKDIYIDYPSNYQNIDYGYTETFVIQTQKLIAITDARKDCVNDLESAHEIVWNKFEVNMQNEGYKRIQILEEEYVTINGIDMYRYVGTMPYEHEGTPYDGYAVGYTFIIDGVPCCLVGSVLDYEQSPEIIEEIDTMVEAMIQTVRTVE